MSDQRRCINLALLDQTEDFRAVAAVHTSGLEGQILAVHIGQRECLRLVIESNYRHNSIRSGTHPRKLEGVLRSGNLQKYICAAVIRVGVDIILTFLRLAKQHISIVFLDKLRSYRIFLAYNDPLRLFQHHAKQRTNTGRSRPDDQNCIFICDLGDTSRPESRCQNISYE